MHAPGGRALKAAGLPEAAIQYIRNSDRAAVGLMLEGLSGAIDLIVPRGGKGLTGRVMREARVPVLAHLEGLCHVYVHEKAELAMARKIVLNAKMRRTSICGAAETLLLDEKILKSHGLPILQDLAAAGCEIRGDEAVRGIFPTAKPATEEDWKTNISTPSLRFGWWTGWKSAITHIEHYRFPPYRCDRYGRCGGGGEIPGRAGQRHCAVERIHAIRRRRRIRNGR